MSAFTLQDEARNTERHHNFWNTDTRLRHSNVSFIRGGSLEPTLPNQPEIDKTTSTLADMALNMDDQNVIMEAHEEREENQGNSEEPVQDLFYIDTQAAPVATGLPPPRVASPTSSDSGSDIILFGGRDEHGKPIVRSRGPVKTISDPIDAKIKQVEEQIHHKEELLEGIMHHDATTEEEIFEKIIIESKIEVDDDIEVEVEEEIEVSIRQAKAKRRRQRKKKPGREHIEQDEEDALIADYLANMDDDPEFLESFGRRELGGTEEEHWVDETEMSDSEPHIYKESRWDRDDINDFDDLSTSDGVMGDVAAILSKRERRSGVQYLVVWEEQSVDEARWVPVTTLVSVKAQLYIEEFEAEEKLVAEFMEGSDSDDDGEDTSDGEDSVEMPTPKEPSKMSDEKYARLLAKQQELGIHGDELLLFDGEGQDEEDGIDEDILFAQHFIPVSKSKRPNKGQNRGGINRAKGDFPVASLLADAYDGFDVMDFERPSLKKKPKGRKGKLVFDLSDSDLEASMQTAWENDRVRKKERKQEREELRSQGLLGNKNGKINMRDKYKEGLNLTQIKEEIRNFLQRDDTT